MTPRWVTVVCDGWTDPKHPRHVLRAGDPGAGMSYGICDDCRTAFLEAAERASSATPPSAHQDGQR